MGIIMNLSDVNIYRIVLTRNWRRAAGKPLPQERFVVFQVHPAGRYQEEFWSQDDLGDAKDLCHGLAKDGRGAYVFDTATQKKVFELKARGG
jgi:hypothetical protein